MTSAHLNGCCGNKCFLCRPHSSGLLACCYRGPSKALFALPADRLIQPLSRTPARAIKKTDPGGEVVTAAASEVAPLGGVEAVAAAHKGVVFISPGSGEHARKTATFGRVFLFPLPDSGFSAIGFYWALACAARIIGLGNSTVL